LNQGLVNAPGGQTVALPSQPAQGLAVPDGGVVIAPGGQTVVVPSEKIEVQESAAKHVVIKEGASIDEIVRALNGLGATPRDILAIIQAIKAAGALQADLEII
jgi:flagellar P-ring protein precursor FlgI